MRFAVLLSIAGLLGMPVFTYAHNVKVIAENGFGSSGLEDTITKMRSIITMAGK